MPRGVAMYFCVVTRHGDSVQAENIVAISRSTSGRIATSPCSKNWRWRSTMVCETRWMVSKRCWTFFDQPAGLLQLPGTRAALPRQHLGVRPVIDPQARIGVRLMLACPVVTDLRTTTSGVM